MILNEEDPRDLHPTGSKSVGFHHTTSSGTSIGNVGGGSGGATHNALKGIRQNTLRVRLEDERQRQAESAGKVVPRRRKSYVGGGFEKEDITLEDLKKLKDVFDRAAEDTGDGQLDEEQFLAAFAPILGGSMSREQLQLWFMRIDASANGSVDWDEFSTFLLMSGDNDDAHATTADGDSNVITKGHKTVAVPPTECSATSLSGYNHSEVVTSIYSHPRTGKYYTGSQDGTVRTWDHQSLEFEGIIHNTKSWITNMCSMKNDSKLVVSSVDRCLSIYDIGHTERHYRSFVGNTTATDKYTVQRDRPLTRDEIDMRNQDTRHGPGAGLPARKPKKGSAVDSLQSFKLRQDRMRVKEQPLPKVDLTIMRQMDAPTMSMVSHRSVPDALFCGLSNGVVQAYNVIGVPSHQPVIDAVFDMPVHDGTVTTLTWVDNLYGFFSTGSDGKVFTINVEHGEKRWVNERFRNNLHPLHSACWVDSSRLLATSGAERNIHLWSTNAAAPPIVLRGHLNSVSHVAYSDSENLLISLDVDKCMRVWDLRTLRSLQTINDYDNYRPVNRLTSLIYDNAHNTVVTACAAPVVWPLSKLMVPFPDPCYTGHQRTVVSVCYNPMFHQIVTADTDVCKIWDVETGEMASTLTMDSLLSSSDVKVDDEHRHKVSIVAVQTDHTHRRLLVALSTSIVFVVNFANGQLLNQLVREQHNGESMLLFPGAVEASWMDYYGAGVKKYVAVVCGRELLIWEDDPDAGFSVAAEGHISVNVTQAQYEDCYRLHRKGSPPPIPHWRAPLPLCVAGSQPQHICVGTDAGMVLVYGASSLEILAVFGDYEPTASIAAIVYNAAKDIVVTGRTDGKVCIYSVGYKDRSVELSLMHRGGHLPSVQSVFVNDEGTVLLAGDEEGYLYVWDISKLRFGTIEPFGCVLAAIGHPCEAARCTQIFQAHGAELAKICFFERQGFDTGFVATCSSDCQARLFTRGGEFIGFCGQNENWDLGTVVKDLATLKKVPAMTTSTMMLTLNDKEAALVVKENQRRATLIRRLSGGGGDDDTPTSPPAISPISSHAPAPPPPQQQPEEEFSELVQDANAFLIRDGGVFSDGDQSPKSPISQNATSPGLPSAGTSPQQNVSFRPRALSLSTASAPGGVVSPTYRSRKFARSAAQLVRDLAPTPSTLSPRFDDVLGTSASMRRTNRQAGGMGTSIIAAATSLPGSRGAQAGNSPSGARQRRETKAAPQKNSPPTTSTATKVDPEEHGSRATSRTRGIPHAKPSANTDAARSASPPRREPVPPEPTGAEPTTVDTTTSSDTLGRLPSDGQNTFQPKGRTMASQRVRLTVKKRGVADLGMQSTSEMDIAGNSLLGQSRHDPHQQSVSSLRVSRASVMFATPRGEPLQPPTGASPLGNVGLPSPPTSRLPALAPSQTEVQLPPALQKAVSGSTLGSVIPATDSPGVLVLPPVPPLALSRVTNYSSASGAMTDGRVSSTHPMHSSTAERLRQLRAQAESQVSQIDEPASARVDMWRASRAKEQYRQKAGAWTARATSQLDVKPVDHKLLKAYQERKRAYFDYR